MHSEFEKAGYVVAKGLLSRSQCETLKSRIEEVIANWYAPGKTRAAEVSWHNQKENSFWIINLRLLDPWIASICASPSVVNTACSVLRCESIVLLEDQYIAKPPGGREVAMHQDDAYFPLLPGGRILSCWIPLSDFDRTAGTLYAIPGSHRWGSGVPPASLHGAEYDAELLHQVAVDDATVEKVELEVSVGDAVFFDGHILHGSGPNRSERWRAAFSMHLADGESRFDRTRTQHTAAPELYAGLADGGPLHCREMPLLSPSPPKSHAKRIPN